MSHKVRVQLLLDEEIKRSLDDTLLSLRKLRGPSTDTPPAPKLVGQIQKTLLVSAAVKNVTDNQDALISVATQWLQNKGTQYINTSLLALWVREVNILTAAPSLALRGALAVLGAQNQERYPWRKERDLYKLYLAEVLLQRTKPAVAASAYSVFVARFPTPTDLLSAGEEAVHELFKNIGFTSRAVGLFKGVAALSQIKSQLENSRSVTSHTVVSELRKIPLVGRYSAESLALHAFGYQFLPINSATARVLLRSLTGVSPSYKSKGSYTNPQLMEIVALLASFSAPNSLQLAHYGLLDVSQDYCTSIKPSCTRCPLSSMCVFANTRP